MSRRRQIPSSPPAVVEVGRLGSVNFDDKSRVIPAASTRAQMSMVLGAGVLLLLITAVIYSPAWAGEFIWDDVGIYIVNNSLLRESDGIYRFWFTNDPQDYYPLTYTTFWFEWQLAGNDSRLYHVTNLVLHVVCGMVLYPLLQRLQIPAPGLVCLIFVVHPLQVESVAWISQRKTILGALFGFAAAAEYLRHLQDNSRWAYVRSLTWFFLSLAGKPTLITLPALLLLYDAVHDRRNWHAKLYRAAPLFLMSLAFGIVGMAYQQKLIAGIDVRHQDFASRVASLGWVLWFYIGQTIRVWSLCFVYPRWQVDGGSLLAWCPNLAVIAVTILFWRQRRRWGPVPLGAWIAYLVSMFPSSGIADVFFWRYSYVGDHYVYQSLPAVLAFAAWAGTRLCAAVPRGSLVGALSGALVALTLGVASYQRAFAYQTEAGLWRDTLERNPRAALAWSNLGVIEHQAGRSMNGRALLEKSVEIDPKLFEAWSNLGEIHRMDSNWQSALNAYQKTLTDAPPGTDFHSTALVGSAIALLKMGELASSLAAGETAVKVLSRQVDLSRGRGPIANLARAWVYRMAACEQAGQATSAAEAHRAVNRLLNDHRGVGREVATALEETGKLQAASQLWSEFLKDSPEDSAALLAAGRVAVFTGQDDAAIELLQRAAEREPSNPTTFTHLGIAFASKGDIDSAVRAFVRATELVPGDSRLFVNLALACIKGARYADAATAFRQAAELEPANPLLLRDWAWLLATSPLAESPDNAREALRLATRACELANDDRPELLDSLAAAQASNGEFGSAHETATRAIQLATAMNLPPARIAQLQERQSLYARGITYRDPPP